MNQNDIIAAIKSLHSVQIVFYNESVHNDELDHETLNALDLAISALEKQVAKKVEKEHCGQSFGEPTYCGECPNCGWTVASAKNHPYELKNNEHCGRCGQKLDWEGDE